MYKFKSLILSSILCSSFIAVGSASDLREEGSRLTKIVQLGQKNTAPIKFGAGWNEGEGSHRWSQNEVALLYIDCNEKDKILSNVKLKMTANAAATHVQRLDICIANNTNPVHSKEYADRNLFEVVIPIVGSFKYTIPFVLKMPGCCMPGEIDPAFQGDNRKLAFALVEAELTYEDKTSVAPKAMVPTTSYEQIDNIQVMLNAVLTTPGEKLVVLDMDEFLVGRIDGSRKRVFLNPDLVDSIKAVRADGTHVIIVSQSSEPTIVERINDALVGARKADRFHDLFVAGLSSINAASKAHVINEYIEAAGINPTTIFMGDDTAEHLNMARQRLANRNLRLYEFCDPRVVAFTAIEQIQATEGLDSFEAAQRFINKRYGSIHKYLNQDRGQDRGVEDFAARARATYQSLMATYGLSTQAEAVAFLRLQFGVNENDKTQDSIILEQFWASQKG